MAVWVSKESWQTLWSAIHNIHIRQSRNIMTPSVTLSGRGTGAKINIAIAGLGSGDSEFRGFFALSLNEKKELEIKNSSTYKLPSLGAGIFISGCDLVEVPVKTISKLHTGVVLLKASCEISEPINKWTIEIVLEKSIPELSEDYFFALLGAVEVVDEQIKVTQLWNNGIIYNNRYS